MNVIPIRPKLQAWIAVRASASAMASLIVQRTAAAMPRLASASTPDAPYETLPMLANNVPGGWG